MSVHDTRALQRLLAVHAVATVLVECNRGLDRAEVVKCSGGVDLTSIPDLDRYSASARALAGMLAEAHVLGATSSHRSSRAWISIRTGEAVSESYVIASTETDDVVGRTQRLFGGRFLDRFTAVDCEWRLADRHFLLDWSRSKACPAQHSSSNATTLAHAVPRGGRGAADAGKALLTLAATRMENGGACSVKPVSETDAVDELLCKQAIHDLLMAYARGMDRADPGLLEAVFWPDASVVSGVINGSGARFAKDITQYLRSNLVRCFHSIANEWVMVNGNRAIGEAYVIATMTAGGDDTIGGGRYINEFERRDGDWKIKSHVFVADWSMTHPTTCRDDEIDQFAQSRGCFGKDDPVYALWATAG